MPHVVSLPPLIEPTGMVTRGLEKFDNDFAMSYHPERRQSILLSSHPKTVTRPIDCILVYNPMDDDHDEGVDHHKRHSKRRQRFETFLKEEHSLFLETEECSSSNKKAFVKIHAPFRTLLDVAEKIRMRLPIEKIVNEETLPASALSEKSRWFRFKRWCKEPFRLPESLFKDDPDYYTAVYSSSIKQFQELFTLRGSDKEYFTPSERSLLTYELLSRVHYNTFSIDQPVPVFKQLDANIVERKREGAKWQGIDRLVAKKVYHGYFPLHESLRSDVRTVPDADLNDREKLQKHWATMYCCFKFQPLSLIRSYMGEKVAFYFAFTGLYNVMLIPAAVVGLIIFIYGAASVATDQPTSDICGSYGSNTYMCPRCDKFCPFWKLSDSCTYSQVSYVFDNVATVVFAGLMSLWARWFVEFWKRREAVLRYDWDSIDFEANLEPVRPNFEAEARGKIEERENPFTREKEQFVPTSKRIRPFFIGAAVVVLLMVILCGTVFATIVYRIQIDYLLKKTSVKTYSSIIITVTSAVMNLICSVLLSFFFYRFAKILTNREMHRYQSTHDDSFTIKIYLFEFVSFYASLFYVAFFKGRFLEYPSKYGDGNPQDFTEQCDPAGCLVELSIQLLIVMMGNQIINNIWEFLFAMRRRIKRCCSRRDTKTVPQWEKDNALDDFASDVLLKEYLELVIQFGFVTLFAVAFPLAPLFALINNLVELRLDAWKFLSKYKRPIPRKASDIGIWNDILSAISHCAVLTNAIVIAWTSEFIPKMTYRVTHSTGTSLSGYVNWTLSSFPIADYNLTGTMPSDVPTNLVYCRYRDFRESTGPSYTQTSMFWNVTAARLAFIVVFEHLIFFIIYVMQWLVPDVPKSVQDKITYERFIDQQGRWLNSSKPSEFENANVDARAVGKMEKRLDSQNRGNAIIKSPMKITGTTSNRRRNVKVRKVTVN